VTLAYANGAACQLERPATSIISSANETAERTQWTICKRCASGVTAERRLMSDEDDAIKITCEGFSVDHSTEDMETRVMVMDPSRKPKRGMRGKFVIRAGSSVIAIEGVARTIKGNLLISGTVGDCLLAVVSDV